MEKSIPNPQVVPSNWYQHTRQDVSNETKKVSIQTGIEKWVQWEKDTKKLYERLYKELFTLGEQAAAAELEKYIIDVDYELAEASQLHIELVTIDYNLSDIIMEQDTILKKYCKKIKEIELC